MPQKRKTSLSKDENSDKIFDSEASSKEITDNKDLDQTDALKSSALSESEDITIDFKNDDSCSTTCHLNTQLTSKSGHRSSSEEVDKLLDFEAASKEITDNKDYDQTDTSKRKSSASSESEDIVTDFKNDDSCCTTSHLNRQLTSKPGNRSSLEEVDTNSDNATNRNSPEVSSKEITHNKDLDQADTSKRKSSASSESEDTTTGFRDTCSSTSQLNKQLTSKSGHRSSSEEVITDSDNATNRTSPSVTDPPNSSEVPCQTETCLDGAWSGICMNCNRSVDDPECFLYQVPLPDDLEVALRPYLSSSDLEQQQYPPPSSTLLRIFIFMLSIFVFLMELLFATFEFYFTVLFGACSVLFSYFYNYN